MTLSAPLLSRLREALGADGVALHEPLELEGAKLVATLRPRSAEAAAAALAVLGEAGAAVLVRGGGSRLETARAPCTAQLLLDTRGLDAEPEIDLEDGVAHISAGTSLAAVHARLAGSGWELPLDPPGSASTFGGALAAAAIGPRFGHPRDVVLGLTLALASGDVAHCGGRVVKNVTGYDLAKLFVGCYGTLGVIAAGWIRLRPTPECVTAWSARVAGALAAGLAAARRPSARAAAALGEQLVVELAGDEAAVREDLAALRAQHGGAEAGDEAIAALRDAQASGDFRVRVAALPTRVAAAAAPLLAAGAQVLVYPARGLVYGCFALAEAAGERVLGEAYRAARLAAKAGGGSFVVEAAPVAAREGREVFSGVGASAALQRALKQQFDPLGVLNPGRFVADR